MMPKPFENRLTQNHAKKLRLIGWLMVVFLVVMSLIKLPPTDISVTHSDKWLHLITYGGLGYWFFHTYFKHKMAVTIGLFFLGSVLEALQGLTSYRYVEWLDAVMNLSGVGLAYVIFWWFKIKINSLIVAR